jgi:hypothetical protein
VDEAVPLGGRFTDRAVLRMCWPSHKMTIYMLLPREATPWCTAMLQAGATPQALVSEDRMKRRER